MNELHEVILVHHLAVGGGEVFSQLKGRHIGLCNLKRFKRALFQVTHEVLNAFKHALPFGFEDFFTHIRVREQVISWRDRVNILTSVKLYLFRRFRIGKGHGVHHALQHFGVNQVGLL